MIQSDVLRLLERRHALRTGTHVVYTSGRHGSAYVNKDALYPHTADVSALCGAIAERYAGAGVEAVVAPAVGGVILSQWVAWHLSGAGAGAPEVLALYAGRAEGGGFTLGRGYDALAAGRRILVVEDVLTTGGSVREVVGAVRAAGGEVLAVAALVNRGGVTAAQVGDPPELFALVDVALDSWPADGCPLCAAGVPVDTTVGKGAAFLARREP